MPLTALMKERLAHREELDPATRKANEHQVRKYIKNYLKDLEEVLWVLEQLPQKQISTLFRDEDVFNLQALEEKTIIFLDFYSMRQRNNLAEDEEYKKRWDVKELWDTDFVEKTLTVVPPEDGEHKLQTISIGREATDVDKKRLEKLLFHSDFMHSITYGGISNVEHKDGAYYYRDLIQDAKRKKLVPIFYTKDGKPSFRDSKTGFMHRLYLRSSKEISLESSITPTLKEIEKP